MSSTNSEENGTAVAEQTNFEAGGFSSGGDMTVGNPLAFVFSFYNSGSPSTGLTIAVGGSAVDQKKLKIHQVGLSYGGKAGRNWLDTSFDEKRGCFVASSNDFDLVPDPQGIQSRLVFAPEQDRQWMHQTLARTLEVELQGEFLADGNTEVIVAVACHENLENTSFHNRSEIEIHKKPRVPFNWPPGNPFPAELRMLESPEKLFALVALGSDTETVPAMVLNAIETWHKVIGDDGIGEYEIDVWADSDSSPWKIRVQPDEIPSGEFWKKIRPSIEISQKFSGVRPSKRYRNCKPLNGWAQTRSFFDFTPHNIEVPFHGFSFSHEKIAFARGSEESVPYLGLWCDIKGLFSQQIDQIENRLVEIVSGLCRETNAYQAMIGRWGYTPRRRLDKTPYEVAFGIDGGCTVAPSWVRRYMRGVTGNLWIGKHMLAYLEDLTELAKLAEISQFDNGAWIKIKNPEQLTALESVLLPILPSRRDWEQILRGMG